MGTRIWARRLAAVVMGLLLAMPAVAQEGAVLVSDKDDYAPGEVAILAGSGFLPGEAIDLSIAINDPVSGVLIGDYDWAEFSADGEGSFVATYTVPPEAADMVLVATAMGLESGLVATARFTDSVSSVTITSPTTASPVTITSLPATLTVYFNYTTSLTGTTTAVADVLGTTATAAKTLTPGVNLSDTIQVTIPAGTVNGSYNLKVTVSNSEGTGAKNKNDNQNNAVKIEVPPPPTNEPPVITCLDPTIDLGEIVGCLGPDGFARTVTVEYDWVAPYVTATVVVDGVTYSANVALVTDPDGDPLTVNLGPDQDVTLVGPGVDLQPFWVDISADDGQETTEKTCGGDVTARIIYAWVGFGPPLSETVTRIVKKGSTVPVKFRLYDCCGNEICDLLGGDPHTIDVVYHSGATPAGDPTVSDSGSSNDNGDAFRYSGVCGVDGNWIFNLSTKTGYVSGATYKILVYLNDGSAPKEALISIK